MYDDDIFRPRTLSDIACNVRYKIFPDGSRDVLCCSSPIFRVAGYEERDPGRKSGSKRNADADTVRAARRAKAMIREYALCNQFTHFVTLTVSPEKADRYSIDELYRHLKVFLSNAVSRKALKYIVIPEHHKDGAIHFHGLFTDAFRWLPSGTFKVPGHKKPIRPRSAKQRLEWEENGFPEILNIPEWAFGFSTAIPLYGDYHAAVAYVCKYIDKQTDGGKIGGRFYYSGGSLEKARIEYDDMPIDFFLSTYPDAYQFDIPETNLHFFLRQEVKNDV